MIHDVYYMISPKSELLSSIGGSCDEMSSILSSSKLWTGQLPDRGALTPVDTENLVKALFLLDIADMPRVLAAVSAASGGNFHLSTDFFDRLWSINRIYEDGNIRESIIKYSDDPRFHEFSGSCGSNIQKFLNSAFTSPC